MSRVMIPTDPYLGKPVRSLQTMLRLLSLELDEIPPVIPDGIFGRTTLQAVSAFQKKYRLPVTGIVNEATWQAISAAYGEAVIRQGPAAPINVWLSPGQLIDEEDPAHIWLLQAMLVVITSNYVNLPAVTVNGSYDASTRKAVAELQRAAGITNTPSGSVDRLTWLYLTHLYRAVTTDEVTQAV